jgi:hypothetical protein
LLSLNSCNKDDQTYCFDCTEYEMVYRNNILTESKAIQTNTFCGLKKSEIGNFEHNYLIYQDSFIEMYSIQICEKTDPPKQ